MSAIKDRETFDPLEAWCLRVGSSWSSGAGVGEWVEEVPHGAKGEGREGRWHGGCGGVTGQLDII